MHSGFCINTLALMQISTAFCPYGVLILFVWFSQQSSNDFCKQYLLTCSLMEAHCILCWVWAEFLCNICMGFRFWKGRDVSQMVSCQPVTVKDQLSSQFSPFELCCGQSGARTGFSILPFSPANIVPPVLRAHLYLNSTIMTKQGWTTIKQSKFFWIVGNGQ